MNPVLKSRLIKAGAGGAVAIAMALGAWFEGTGPTEKAPDGSILFIPYKDPVGIWTVCHGVTGPEVVPGKRYTTNECNVLERAHYQAAEISARRMFPLYDNLNKWQKGAILDWLYNLGENDATRNSTLRARVNSGDIDAACREMVKWVKGRVKGSLVTLPGLVTRREATMELCLNWKD